MMSGMTFTGHPAFDPAEDYAEREFLELIREPLRFAPGTDWSYSNTGYFLLGIIAERATGQLYGNLLDRYVFDPLGMEQTGYDTAWISEQVAHGFWRTVDGIAPMPTYAMSTLFSTGGMYSTAWDLHLWDQALHTDRLLSDSLKAIYFQPVKNHYACGWYVKRGVDPDGEAFERHFHGGWIKGYHAFILRRIPPKQVVILLDNTYSQEIQTIKNRIWSALIEEKVGDIKPKLSNALFAACGRRGLYQLVDSLNYFPGQFEDQYTFEEYDINTVGYRLMDAGRYLEAEAVLLFNMERYPDSWNVYDSFGELMLRQNHLKRAEHLYKRSLELNPDNGSATAALEEIKRRREKD